MSKRKWTDEQFIEAVKTSLSHAEVMRKLGLKPAGSNYETVNKLDMTREREYQDRVAEFKADYERYNSKMQEFRSQFNNWRTSEQERISQLKITLPTNLLGIFEEIRKQGDPSSK